MIITKVCLFAIMQDEMINEHLPSHMQFYLNDCIFKLQVICKEYAIFSCFMRIDIHYISAFHLNEEKTNWAIIAPMSV